MDFVINYARKASIAAVVAGIGALGVALSDGDISVAEALISAGAALTAFAGTFGVANS